MTSKDAKVNCMMSKQKNPVYVISAGYQCPSQQVPSLLAKTGKDNSSGLVAAMTVAAAAVVLASLALALQLASPREDLEARVAALTAEVAGLKASSAAFRVSFIARMLKNGKPAEGETLVFPNVPLNQGGGYDGSTGVFTAPTAGVYAILATLGGWGRRAREATVWVELVKEGARQAQVWTEGDREGDWDYTTLTAVLHLDQGQRVWLRAKGTLNRFWNYDYDCSFSAFLVQGV